MPANGFYKLHQRVTQLEAELIQVRSQLAHLQSTDAPWWERSAGMFKDDEAFEEIVRRGQAIRKAERRQAQRKPAGETGPRPSAGR